MKFKAIKFKQTKRMHLKFVGSIVILATACVAFKFCEIYSIVRTDVY